jgi:WD40 repeat protein
MYQQQGRSELRDSASYTLLADTERLILAYSTPISISALQVYHSAVATMPSCLLWETLGQHYVGITLLVSQRATGWGPRVKIIYGNAFAAVFSPDIRYILSRHSTAQLWDAATGTQLYSTTSNASGDCTAIAFSPDGQSVSCGFSDGTVEVLTISTWTKQAVLPGCSNTLVATVTFTPDSQSVVSASQDGTVQVWALTQQTQEVFTTGCRISSSANVVFSLDCRLMAVTKCDDGAARVWKIIPGARPEPLVIARPANGLYHAAALSPDGCSVVFGAEDGIHVWDTAMGIQRSRINGHSDIVTAVAFSRDGQFLASGSENGTILVWNFSAGAQQLDYVLKGHHGMVLSVAFSPDAKLVVSTSYDGTMRVWSAAVSMNESAMEGHTGVVTDIAFSHDGGHIASGSEDSSIRLWDASTGRQKHILEGHEGGITLVVFSPDSQTVASCAAHHTVRLWDVATGTEVYAVLHHPWHPHHVVFSHDGLSIAVISQECRVYVWEVATGTQKFVISYHPLSSELSHRDTNPVIFSPSDQLLLATLHSEMDSSSSDGSDEESTSSSNGESDEESTSSRSGKSDEEITSSRSDGSDKEAIDYKVWDASTGVELAVQDLAPALARDMDGALLSRDEQSVALYYTRVYDGWIVVSHDEDRYHSGWHRVCWLPAERQPPRWDPLASHGHKVCIGPRSGAVTILDLSNVPMPWAR